MAWGGKGGQVDRNKKTGKSTVERAVTADKKQKSNAAEIAKLKKRIARGGMSMKRGQLKSQLERRIRNLEGGGKKTTPKVTPTKSTNRQSLTTKKYVSPYERKHGRKQR